MAAERVSRTRRMTEGPGFWGMRCFNALTRSQQYRLVMHGSLPFGFRYEGECPNVAELEVTTMYDLMPGPRFYCLACAVAHLSALDPEAEWADLEAAQ